MRMTVSKGWLFHPTGLFIALCVIASATLWTAKRWVAPKPTPKLVAQQAIKPAPVPARAPRGNVTTVAGFQFSDRDIARYQALYALQSDQAWLQANRQIGELENDVLLGDLLAERFLHPSYKSSYSELYHWLKRNETHPDAARIYALAKRKRPSGQPLPDITVNRQSLKGHGLRDGMEGRSMPKGWRSGLDAWDKRNYSSALKIFRQIASSNRSNSWQKSAAHFWAYRASSRLNQTGNAQAHLREAANYPFTFYGALAASVVQPDTYRARFAKVSGELVHHPAIKRAAALVAIGNAEKAERELRHLFPQLSTPNKRQLVTLAAAMDLPSAQLRMSQMLFKDPQQSDITAYPTPNWVPHYDMRIDPALVYAIIRQESAFNKDATSHAGARGAMQIMPETANYVINHYDLNQIRLASLDVSALPGGKLSHRQLERTDVNLLIGQHYIHYLSEKPYINGNLIYLLAAYNAGPGNLIKWQKRFGQVDDPLRFIEKIPFKETRHYVQQVMANYLVYQSLIHGQAQSAQQLRNNSWPALQIGDRYASLDWRQFAQRQ